MCRYGYGSGSGSPYGAGGAGATGYGSGPDSPYAAFPADYGPGFPAPVQPLPQGHLSVKTELEEAQSSLGTTTFLAYFCPHQQERMADALFATVTSAHATTVTHPPERREELQRLPLDPALLIQYKSMVMPPLPQRPAFFFGAPFLLFVGVWQHLGRAKCMGKRGADAGSADGRITPSEGADFQRGPSVPKMDAKLRSYQPRALAPRAGREGRGGGRGVAMCRTPLCVIATPFLPHGDASPVPLFEFAWPAVNKCPPYLRPLPQVPIRGLP